MTDALLTFSRIIAWALVAWSAGWIVTAAAAPFVLNGQVSEGRMTPYAAAHALVERWRTARRYAMLGLVAGAWLYASACAAVQVKT